MFTNGDCPSHGGQRFESTSAYQLRPAIHAASLKTRDAGVPRFGRCDRHESVVVQHEERSPARGPKASRASQVGDEGGAEPSVAVGGSASMFGSYPHGCRYWSINDGNPRNGRLVAESLTERVPPPPREARDRGKSRARSGEPAVLRHELRVSEVGEGVRF
jgi:hypothetical protein